MYLIMLYNLYRAMNTKRKISNNRGLYTNLYIKSVFCVFCRLKMQTSRIYAQVGSKSKQAPTYVYISQKKKTHIFDRSVIEKSGFLVPLTVTSLEVAFG